MLHELSNEGRVSRKRELQIKFRVTPAERALLSQKMAQLGTPNMEAYLRKMALDGHVLRLDVPELKEMVSLLRRCSNNLNQMAKRANQTGQLFAVDVEDLAEKLDQLWEAARQIMTALAQIG